MFLSCGLLQGQEVFLESAVVTPAGNGFETGTLNVSRWRLALINQLVLPGKQTCQSPDDDLYGLPDPDWKVIAFPNPFNRTLSLLFQSDREIACIVRVTGMSGKQWFLRDLNIDPLELTSIDLAFLPPGTYLVTVVLKNGQQQVIKVQKN